MHRVILIISILILSAQLSFSQESEILGRCPTLAGIIKDGRLEQIRNPVFEDRDSARKFASLCAKVVKELDAVAILPSNYAELRGRAALAAEFLTADAHDLTTSNVISVRRLRNDVRIPPPSSLVYVRIYDSADSMPAEVSAAFRSLTPHDGRSHVQGVTMHGRYIAILHSEYEDEVKDVLAHELVHAYISLASPENLPVWFQEAAAVYFSTGQDSRLYGNAGDPRMKQVTLPNDYKNRLHSFRYIESRVGRERLFQFVRESVETGVVDARSTLGIGDTEKPFKPNLILVTAVVGVAVLIFGGVCYISHRRECLID